MNIPCLIKRFLALAGLAVFATIATAQHAFPTKPVRLIVPYSAGGSVDVLARGLAVELGKTWDQPVIVENVVGAASIVAAQRMVNSAPDGHTLMFTLDGTVVANRFLYKKLPYDPDASLVPISMVGRSALFVIVPPTSTANSMRDLIDAAAKAPGTIAYSSGGTGTPGHLLFELIGSRAGVKFLHVPYKGVAPALNAVLASEVQLSAASPGQAGEMIKAGRIKALAITDPKRSAQFPGIPTVGEAGYPYAAYSFWWGMFAPRGTPADVVEKISRDLVAIVKQPDFSSRSLAGVGIEPVGSSPKAFSAAIQADVEKYGEMVKAAHLQPMD